MEKAAVTGTRLLSLTLTPISGGIHYFIVTIDGVPKINAKADSPKNWSGNIPNTPTVINVKALGVGNAKYSIDIDLPGTIADSKINAFLNGGYNGTKIII